MFKEQLNDLKSMPCMRLDSKAEAEYNKALWHKFRTRFPKLLGDIDPLSFYLPKGWENICGVAFSFLEEQGVKLIQVKQKFGTLRLYTETPCTGECLRVINTTESLASLTCEFCGSTDKVEVFDGGYVSSSCISCRTALCEYTILNWVLNGETEQMNEAQLSCVRELRK